MTAHAGHGLSAAAGIGALGSSWLSSELRPAEQSGVSTSRAGLGWGEPWDGLGGV